MLQQLQQLGGRRGRGLCQLDTSRLSLVGPAASIILLRQKFFMMNTFLSRQTRVCHDKTCFLSSQKVCLCLSQQNSFVATNKCLLRQKLCRDKHTSVATKNVFCRDKHVFVAIKLSSQQKFILVAALANHTRQQPVR